MPVVDSDGNEGNHCQQEDPRVPHRTASDPDDQQDDE